MGRGGAPPVKQERHEGVERLHRADVFPGGPAEDWEHTAVGDPAFQPLQDLCSRQSPVTQILFEQLIISLRSPLHQLLAGILDLPAQGRRHLGLLPFPTPIRRVPKRLPGEEVTTPSGRPPSRSAC